MLWLWQVFEYAFSSKYARAWNKSRLWICESCKGCLIYLNKPEYALIMPQYALIMREYALMMLNMLEYAYIYLNKKSSWYARILNVPDTVPQIYEATVEINEQLLRHRSIQNTVKHFRWNVLQKSNAWVQASLFRTGKVSWS